ncbi:hypothetical protein [Hoeflea poritis]|uniref:UBC core domain-containing protein n=1 Tax=Hoeflea poritis TaxID=2993659 RepID=A0ABT4VV66_9HYPH|nr:hypothetical protein [Hoeflea poritis]MDA4848599.1 hypothetical protein [Hoeflea poritis]
MKEVSLGVRNFLKSQPRMVLRPSKSSALTLEGLYEFAAVDEHGNETFGSYNLRIEIPENFPREMPTVFEVGQKIPRKPENHVNLDGSLCLGSPLRLKLLTDSDKTLLGFASNCIFPFLYAHSLGRFLFGELSHGLAGLIEDYKDMLDVQTERQVVQFFTLASLRRRIANKRKCPCGCDRRLGVCEFRHKINSFRSIAPRSWFATHKAYIERQI